MFPDIYQILQAYMDTGAVPAADRFVELEYRQDKVVAVHACPLGVLYLKGKDCGAGEALVRQARDASAVKTVDVCRALGLTETQVEGFMDGVDHWAIEHRENAEYLEAYYLGGAAAEALGI